MIGIAPIKWRRKVHKCVETIEEIPKLEIVYIKLNWQKLQK